MKKIKLAEKVIRKKSAAVVIKAGNGKFVDVDKGISAMAKKGQLNYSGENAVRRSLKNGLSVTIMEDDGIYKIHPDGSRIRVKKQSQVYRDAETGKFYKK
jgi:hypothetical protein